MKVRSHAADLATPKASAPASCVCQRVAKLQPNGSAIKCLFSDGSSLELSRFLGSFVRSSDHIEFDPTAVDPARELRVVQGALLVAGELSPVRETYFAKKILSFLPDRRERQFRAPLRKVEFFDDHAVYRDSQRKAELTLDQISLPLAFDPTWNQWRHLIGTTIPGKSRDKSWSTPPWWKFHSKGMRPRAAHRQQAVASIAMLVCVLILIILGISRLWTQ